MGHHYPTGQQVPDYTGVNLQTASMSEPAPLAWGMSRGSPNLIDYVDFKVHKKTVGKGGSFFGKQTQYSYSASILLALCEGPIAGIGECYINTGQTTDFAGLGFALFTGATPQAPWSYLVANFPSHALGYQGVAYLAAANYNLGQSEALPSHSFEVKAPLYNTGFTGGGDADCALLVQDFLTNTQYGAYFPAARLDTAALLSGPNATTTGDSAYQTYCRAMGWGLSPFIQSQEPAIEILSRWCQVTNTAPVWTGYSLKLVPFGDAPVTGAGVTFLPPTAPVFSFTDDDYVQDNDDDPVQVQLDDWFDAYNAIALECRDRDYMYNTVPIDWIDLGGVQTLGRRQAPVVQGHEICVVAMARQVVQLIGQRMVYVRRRYTFKVGPEHSRLEPMDCGAITETAVLGLAAVPVRIRSLEEQDDGDFQVIVEEFPGTVGSPASVATTGGAGPTINALVAPSPVNPPIIFEPNSAAAAFLNGGSGAPLIVALVSGGAAGAFDPNWGGCVVNVSTDNVTYAPLADIRGATRVAQPAAMGPLTATLPSFGGANPDTSDTLSVSLAESNGALISASSGVTAAAGATLGVIQAPGFGAVELVGPQTATLTGANAYDLTGLYRGLFGTAAGAHTTAHTYGRLDSSAFIAALPAAYVGVTLYFKFQSFNIWGAALEDLSTCAVYQYTPTGAGFGGGAGGAPTAPTGLSATGGAGQVALAWTANPATDNVTSYRVFRAPGSGAPFGSATLLATIAGLDYADSGLGPATSWTYFLEAANAIGPSAPSAGVSATTSTAGPAGAVRLVQASEALAAGAFVNVWSSAGAIRARNADATDDSKPADGFVLAAVASGQTATVFGVGQQNTALSGLTPGAAYYLDLSGAGGVTATVPTGAGAYQQLLGKADTAAALTFVPQVTGMGA